VLAQEIDPGLASETQETLHYLVGFLREERPDRAANEEELNKARIEGRPVVEYAGEFWFLFDAFVEHVGRLGLREPMRVIWRRIKETGLLRDEKTFRAGGVHYTRRYWRVSGQYVDTQ